METYPDSSKTGRVFYAGPVPGAIDSVPYNALLNVVEHAAMCGHRRLHHPHARIDVVRNRLVRHFLDTYGQPGDVLVMYDADHLHPPELVDHLGLLGKKGFGCVSALTFRRITPHTDCAPDALIYAAQPDGRFSLVRQWARGALVDCAFAGFGAVAIRYEVFRDLEAKGYRYPFFKYEYRDDTDSFPTEDIYFGHACHDAGIPWHCDTGLETPHLSWTSIDTESFDLFPWAEYDALPEGPAR